MKLEKKPSGKGFIRAKELLRAQPLEKIDFQADRDLTAAQAQELFNVLDDSLSGRAWPEYYQYFLWLESLWSDMQGKVLSQAPEAEIQKKIDDIWGANRPDLVMHHLANMRALGLKVDSFLQPELVEDFLSSFDQPRGVLDFSFPQDALAVVNLGLRPLLGVFSDREGTWQKCKTLLASFHSVDLGMFAQLVVEMKLLFPEHAGELVMESEDIRELKQQLLQVSPQARSKTGRNAYYLKLVTAGRVTLGPNGEYVAETNSGLAQPAPLPERDIT